MIRRDPNFLAWKEGRRKWGEFVRLTEGKADEKTDRKIIG